MLILHDKIAGHVHLLFGLGLVGRTIKRQIQHLNLVDVHPLPFGWKDHPGRKDEAKSIVQKVVDLTGKSLQPTMLNIIWSAGSGGFNESAAELKGEFDAFSAVLEIATVLNGRYPKCRTSFHLVSTAGGLYEGQRFVDSQSQPKPTRPYGDNKLRQEVTANALKDDLSIQIYRPSSIFGFEPSTRWGLMSVLLRNSFAGVPTTITGSPDTLRDYIFVDDIGRFIANRLSQFNEGSQTHFMVSGKATSILETIKIIGEQTGRPSYLQYQTAPSNSLHNSYRFGCRPAGLDLTPLKLGMQLTAARIQAHIF